MKKLTTLLAVGAVLGLASTASAGNQSVFDVVAETGSSLFGPSVVLGQGDQPPPAPGANGKAAPKGPKVPMGNSYKRKMKPAPQGKGRSVQLYRNVKYKDLDEVAPCAVPKIIRVPNPCYKPCSCCCPQQPRCVYIKVCVPHCGCAEVDVEDDGDVELDYGEYAIDVRQKDHYIEVDYQD